MADESQVQTDVSAVKNWAAQKKISLVAIEQVIDLGFTSLEALECLQGDDLKKSKIPIGQQKLLLKAVGEFLSPPPSILENTQNQGLTVQTPAAREDASGEDVFASRLSQLGPHQGRGDVDHLSSLGIGSAGASGQPNGGQSGYQQAPVTGNVSWQDPQVYLKSLSSTKSTCYNVVDFVDVGAEVSEKIVSSGEDFVFLCRSGSKKPKLESLSIAQWSSANIAILYKLVQEGMLSKENVFDYLSYTTFIYGLMHTHDLVSIFYYDREYRRLQHLHNFRWGTAVNHLAPGFLRLKAPVQASPSQSSGSGTRYPVFNGASRQPDRSGDRSNIRFNFASHTSAGKVICKRYNGRSGCSMRGCKFEHVCNVPGCGLGHPGVQHSESKNP